MAKKGSITIYLCLMLSVFLLLFQVIYRSVRIAGARTQLSVGIHQSLYSVFARYDPVLLEQYGLLFVDGSFGGEKFRQDLLCDCIYQGMKRRFCSGKRMEEEYLGTAHRSCGSDGIYAGDGSQRRSFSPAGGGSNEKKTWGARGYAAFSNLWKERGKFLRIRMRFIRGKRMRKSWRIMSLIWEELKKEQEEEGEELQTPAEPVENPIDVIRKIWKKGVLGLVVKDLENLSEESFEKQELVSGRTLEKGFGLQVLPGREGNNGKAAFSGISAGVFILLYR